jgi:hypothetical protein
MKRLVSYLALAVLLLTAPATAFALNEQPADSCLRQANADLCVVEVRRPNAGLKLAAGPLDRCVASCMQRACAQYMDERFLPCQRRVRPGCVRQCQGR